MQRIIKLAALGLAISSPVYADFTVDTPIVDKGYADIETTNSFAFDHRNAQNAVHEHRLGFDYAPLQGWLITMEGVEDKEPRDDWRFIGTNIESVVTLTRNDDHWLSSGVRVHYTIGHDRNPGQAEAALLLEKTIGKFTYTANFVFDRETGPERESAVAGALNWRVLYGYEEALNPAIEAYSSVGRANHFAALQDEEHRIGPVLQGKLGRIDYDIGWLFGLTNATADHMLKVNLNYEF
ncbi:MAG: hypothetical protein KGJ06_06435 [Pseudomonadota bacterium]|nr:hypothetical protein [Pseudomonadota bacterium]